MASCGVPASEVSEPHDVVAQMGFPGSEPASLTVPVVDGHPDGQQPGAVASKELSLTRTQEMQTLIIALVNPRFTNFSRPFFLAFLVIL